MDISKRRKQFAYGASLYVGSENRGAMSKAASLPTGFFIVAARDSADAVALAESCPHLKHGGRVAVRAIRAT